MDMSFADQALVAECLLSERGDALASDVHRLSLSSIRRSPL
jgi:hypothetical protein